MALPSIQNISQFGSIIRDISRPYLFLIRIPFLDDDDVVTAFARSAVLPEYSVSTVEVAFQTQKLRLMGTAEFSGTWDVEFLCDEGHTMRNKLIGWMSRGYDPSILRNGAPDEYKVDDMQIHQLGRDGDTIVSYQFVGMYPSKVGEISVSHDQSNEPEKFTCTFTYDMWTMGGGGLSLSAIISTFLSFSLSTGRSRGGFAQIGGAIGGVVGKLGIRF